MNAIGGYLELELNQGNAFHLDAIALNTGRNAFEYVLLANSYSKVYLPYFSCDVLLEPLKKHHIVYEFYHIDEHFEPRFDYQTIREREALLYINYFGLKDHFISSLSKISSQIIIDNSQSFFSKLIAGIDTFYSARKFFGVPDGAYVYSAKKLNRKLVKDQSFDRCSHLLKRLDHYTELGYQDFVKNESSLQNQDIKEMSGLTKAILASINYKNIAHVRIQNFKFLHDKLQMSNRLKINVSHLNIPMVYPYWSHKVNMREHLMAHNIFTATYWANVKQWVDKNILEYQFVDEIVYLPIDQRYHIDDLCKIIKVINDV